MTFREFLDRVRQTIDRFEDAQTNEGVDLDDDIEPEEVLEEMTSMLHEQLDFEDGDDPEDDSEEKSDDDEPEELDFD